MSGQTGRLMGAAMAITLGAATLSACGDSTGSGDGPKKTVVTLGFVNGGNTEFHTCLQRSVEGEAAQRGVKVISANSKQDAKTELANIDSMIAQGVDAIIVQTVNTGALKADIERAGRAKIPIFLTSVAPDDTSTVLGAVAVDLNQVGLLDAGWVSNDAVGAPRTAGIVAGAPGAASDLLVKGFVDGLPKNIKVVATAPGMFNRAKAKTAAAKMIKEHPDIAYAFVVNEDMAFGVQQAFAAAHKNVKIATVNGTDAGLAAIKDGRFGATVAIPASKLGQKAVENTLSLLDKEPITKIDYVPINLITKTDIDQAPRYCLTG
ncbi:sugar ABC transporter substrate-binding protein [Actinoplanes sp. NPDC051513]|uniref:sugar ABC transporter substrate-binding protein n=1 Tax=Actinoplanes sp. NPDC051513 TaxID=3363908 RepID=UPI0037AFF447